MSETTDPLCAECGIPLSPDEAHCCDDCAAFFEMTDPNGYGDDNEENQAAV